MAKEILKENCFEITVILLLFFYRHITVKRLTAISYSCSSDQTVVDFKSHRRNSDRIDRAYWEVNAELDCFFLLASYILLAHQNRHVSACAALGLKSQLFMSDCLPFLVPILTLSATIKRLAAMCVFPPALKGDPVAPIFLINCSYKWCHLASPVHWLFQY